MAALRLATAGRAEALIGSGPPTVNRSPSLTVTSPSRFHGTACGRNGLRTMTPVSETRTAGWPATRQMNQMFAPTTNPAVTRDTRLWSTPGSHITQHRAAPRPRLSTSPKALVNGFRSRIIRASCRNAGDLCAGAAPLFVQPASVGLIRAGTTDRFSAGQDQRIQPAL